jgi:hypothetical protein
MMKPERARVEHGRVAKLRHAVVWLKCLAPPGSEARFDRITKKILNDVAPGTAKNYLSKARCGVGNPSWHEIVAASEWALHENLPDLILERYRKEVDDAMAPLRCALERPELLKVVIKVLLLRWKLGQQKFAEVGRLIVPDIIRATLGRS